VCVCACAAAEAFGPADILVNNAGFTWDGMLHKMSDDQVYCVAVCCSMLQCVAVYRYLGQQR